MKVSDWQILDSFLERLSSAMGAAGCNDFDMPVTEDNLDLARAAYCGEEELRVIGGKIICFDFAILDELRKRLREEVEKGE